MATLAVSRPDAPALPAPVTTPPDGTCNRKPSVVADSSLPTSTLCPPMNRATKLVAGAL